MKGCGELGIIKGVILAIFAALFVYMIVQGFIAQNNGNLDSAFANYFIGFIFLGVAKVMKHSGIHGIKKKARPKPKKKARRKRR